MAGTIDYKFADSIFVASISGYADEELMTGLAEHFFAKLDEDFTYFVFNFANMTLINSSALGKLLEIIAEAMGNDGVNLAFCSVPATSKLGMTSLGLLDYVEEFATLDEALKSINAK